MLTWPPHSLDFFLEKMTCIRCELDFDLCPCVFSVDFDAHPRTITTTPLYFEHVSLHRLQEIIRETKKMVCFLDPINASKVESIYVFAVLFIKKR